MLSTVRSAIITHTRSKNNPACKSAGVKNCTALLLSSKAATAIYSFARMCLCLCSDWWQNRFAGGGIQTFSLQSALLYHFHTALQLRRNNNSSFTCVPRTKSIVLFISTWSLSGYMYVPGVPLDLQVQRVGNKAICRRLYHAGNKLQH